MCVHLDVIYLLEQSGDSAVHSSPYSGYTVHVTDAGRGLGVAAGTLQHFAFSFLQTRLGKHVGNAHWLSQSGTASRLHKAVGRFHDNTLWQSCARWQGGS